MLFCFEGLLQYAEQAGQRRVSNAERWGLGLRKTPSGKSSRRVSRSVSRRVPRERGFSILSPVLVAFGGTSRSPEVSAVMGTEAP